ncbi:MAG TPA: SDR family oxidoreductase [Ktedonobacteraceae bacterium]|jgi:NAD(P)-dependent dehydrogenase (short-subunit alcohol dehydrogenase family)|nr:SDR family oxidoreductase [Ktedonobacteraceae bacterium]
MAEERKTRYDIPSLFSVAGKVALITGASGGLGQAAAFGFAEAGAKVMLTGRSADKLGDLAGRINEAGGVASYVTGHPASAQDVQRVVEATVEQFGGIDVLITAAGVNHVQPIVEQPLEDWQEVMDVNVRGTWLACKEAGRVMIQQGRGGKVILFSSTRGALGMSNYSAYSPSKGAIHLLTRSLACEWGKYGINVNAIAPTVIRTALTQWMFDDKAFYKNFLTRIPIGRLGEPEDLVGTLLYLASRASDFMTGNIVYLDGGYTAG